MQDVIKLSKGFFLRYWWEIILLFIIAIIIAKPLAKKVYKKVSMNRLRNYKLELKILEDLLKKTQMDYFKRKTITQDTYKIRSERYKRKINLLRRKLPVLESIVYEYGKNRRIK